MKTRSRAKTHFVPRTVYRTAFVGVVPVCVAGAAAAACSSGSSGSVDAAMNYSVACSGFCGVAQRAFADASDAMDAPADATADAGDATPCFCCTNFCGVGVMAFADVGVQEASTDVGKGE